MSFGEVDGFPENFSLLIFRGGFCDPEDLVHHAFFTLGVKLERLFLNVETEPFPFLFPATDTGKPDVTLHGLFPLQDSGSVKKSAKGDNQVDGILICTRAIRGAEHRFRLSDQFRRDPVGILRLLLAMN